jgi:dienelactone hydrolase
MSASALIADEKRTFREVRFVATKSPIGTSRQPGDRSTVDLVIYPDAYHSFDAAGLPPGYRYLGHRLQYNEAATQDAINRVHNFLERTVTSSDR